MSTISIESIMQDKFYMSYELETTKNIFNMLYENLEKNVDQSYTGDDIPEDLIDEIGSSFYYNFLEQSTIAVSYSYLISIATIVEKNLHILEKDGISIDKYKMIRDCRSSQIPTTPLTKRFDRKLKDFWTLRNLIAHCNGAVKYGNSSSRKILELITKKNYNIELLDHSILIPKSFMDNICDELIDLFNKIFHSKTI